MDAFPHRYAVAIVDGQLSAPPRQPISLGPPPQFGGNDRVWSPEELLVGAVLECLWTTFEAFARRDKLDVRRWRASGVGVLERGRPVPTFTSIELSVHIEVNGGDEARARACIEKAESNCIVSHALNVPVKVNARVNADADLSMENGRHESTAVHEARSDHGH